MRTRELLHIYPGTLSHSPLPEMFRPFDSDPANTISNMHTCVGTYRYDPRSDVSTWLYADEVENAGWD